MPVRHRFRRGIKEVKWWRRRESNPRPSAVTDWILSGFSDYPCGSRLDLSTRRRVEREGEKGTPTSHPRAGRQSIE